MKAARAASQLPLPLPSSSALSRSDFIVAPANANAVAFIDSWPDWPVSVAALYGPAGCGKTHLVSIWRERSDAQVLPASEVLAGMQQGARPCAIEDVDCSDATPVRDAALIAAFENARLGAPLLFTGKGPPTEWPFVLPDLSSRFRALAALPLWSPDDEMLAALARKLFADRQLAVPEAVIEHMLRLLERSPGAIREFVAEADAVALADARPVNTSLVRELIAAREKGAP
jgi:chromosomal replication initiation ATPase DnaA